MKPLTRAAIGMPYGSMSATLPLSDRRRRTVHESLFSYYVAAQNIAILIGNDITGRRLWK